MNLRPDLKTIASWIQPNSRVLDLGCGDGELLHWLAHEKQVFGYGVEIDVHKVAAGINKGLNIIQTDLESGLSAFESNSFDYVVLSLTLQAMRNVETIMAEILRVGRTGIITFPNFGYWENRWQLLLGRMPVSDTLPYQWYDTPNIHLCTLNDFDAFCQEHGWAVLEKSVTHQGQVVQFLPNWRGSVAFFRIETQTTKQLNIPKE